MFDWEDLRHFTALAREKSLSAAAKKLRVEHATVSRRVSALEGALKLKLVDRRARSYELTADGLRIAAIGFTMESEAFGLERFATTVKASISGEVSLSAPPALANRLIAPRLTEFFGIFPEIRIRLIGEKRPASLSRKEADLAVRIGRPTENTLVARKIGLLRFGLYASVSYFDARSFDQHAFIAYDESSDDLPQQKWLMNVAAGRPIVVRTNDLHGQHAAARSGAGIAALPDFLAAGDASMARVYEQEPPLTRELWLVVHRDLKAVPRVRAFMNFLLKILRAETTNQLPR